MLGSTLCLIFSCDIDVHLSIIPRIESVEYVVLQIKEERGGEKEWEREREGWSRWKNIDSSETLE